MFGLNILFEAIKQSESAEKELDNEMKLMESVTDDEIKRLVVGDDSIENDMEGNGIDEEEEKRLEEFISKIPLTKDIEFEDTDDEEEADEVTMETLALLESTLEI